MYQAPAKLTMVPSLSSWLPGLAAVCLTWCLLGCRKTEAPPVAADASEDTAERSEETAPAAVEQISLEKLKASNRYVQSGACQECHADQYNSWHATYHRTMTQEASPETILGNFDGEVITLSGYPCQPVRQGDRFFMTLVHPGWDEQEIQAGRDPKRTAQPPAITYAVDRVIGSHHQQVYLSRGPDGSYHTLPLVWHIHQKRWITRRASFLAEPREGFFHKTKLWNNGCVFCHNTGPVPGLQQVASSSGGTQYVWNTRVEELGIACEACHGPGGAHVQLQQTLAKIQQDGAKAPEQLIVNPLKLSQEESVLTCARCHGKMIAKQEFDRQCLVEGDFFQPGQWDFPDRYDYPSHRPGEDYHESEEGVYFWSDGTPRTTAMEYQGILLSPCYQQGEMTCLSCHGMHGTPANDQLLFGDGRDVSQHNRACTQCHAELDTGDQLAQHTHHSATSSGSLCYNCHMPYQAYSLLKRVRSHRITNPTAKATVESGIPNACNQCHVDQSLEWTNQWLANWAGKQPESLEAPYAGSSSTVGDALAGHALQRALAVEQLGATENFAVAGQTWRARILIESLEDEYDATRLLAYQALLKMPGFDDFQFDYIGTEEERAVQIQDARQRWRAIVSDPARQKLAEVLGGSSETDPDTLIDRLKSRRNKVSIDVLE